RLQRVIDALDTGQVLPPHRCILHDAPDAWPVVWRHVLAKLNIVEPPGHDPHGADGYALHAAQTVVLGGDIKAIEQDSTFRYVHTRSESVAVEFITAALAGALDELSTTVICCEDDDLAVRLDACLSRVGLPTTGASVWSRAHPVLQVLPLSLALCYEPVDPQALLDFLTLPILPVPRKAATRLAEALTEEPGLGSSQWDKAIDELCDEEHDSKGKLRERLNAWLLFDRISKGDEIPSRLIRSRCGMVAQWASGRASSLAKDDESSPELIAALQVAAGQASLLGELAESQGMALSEPQLARLLEEVLANGVESTSCVEADGGPIRVRSLAEIDGACNRLIWLGLGTGDAAGCRWSTDQLRELQAARIDVDDGSQVLTSLRSAEARGYGYVKGSFLAVLLPQDLAKRWHPIWLAIRALLPEKDIEQPPVFEDLIASGAVDALAPFTFECRDVEIEPPQKPRLLWNIPADLLCDRETVSATELQDRLGCPLKWTFNYQAKLRPSTIAELPGDFQLKGTFCHSIFERVFGGGGDLPTVDEAVARVAAAFDERLPRDAAPLAQPDKYFERERLRGEMENATRVLVGTLASGGYRITGIEVELSGEAFGKPLKGWIDCVAERDNGDEAIIDFKYGGRSKYYSLIEEGRGVQLATYAYGRSTRDGTFPAVAYLVLADGLLYTPSGSPIHGDGNRSLINAPAIESVWRQFSDAIEKADDWLTSDAPVPARPLQDPTQWPDGADKLVLDPKLKADATQDVCKYCNYKSICGIQETS
ncbi:MAG: PD-(D/E)XK nuclease family protein, partial [Planctomycetaceae bacterium]